MLSRYKSTKLNCTTEDQSKKCKSQSIAFSYYIAGNWRKYTRTEKNTFEPLNENLYKLNCGDYYNFKFYDLN